MLTAVENWTVAEGHPGDRGNLKSAVATRPPRVHHPTVLLPSRTSAYLAPSVAIEVASPAVASVAWFAMNGGQIDDIAMVLAGYGILMVGAQLRPLPVFPKLPIIPGTWSFTFTWAAVARTLIFWLDLTVSGPLAVIAQILVLAAATALIGIIAIKTVLRLAAGTYLPTSAPAQPVAPDAPQPIPKTAPPSDRGGGGGTSGSLPHSPPDCDHRRSPTLPTIAVRTDMGGQCDARLFELRGELTPRFLVPIRSSSANSAICSALPAREGDNDK